jgi:hypothetical protein
MKNEGFSFSLRILNSPTKDPPGGGGTQVPANPILSFGQLNVPEQGEVVVYVKGQPKGTICGAQGTTVVTAASIRKILKANNVGAGANVLIEFRPSKPVK